MSLLMDALKRAEQSKRQQQGEPPGLAVATDAPQELSLQQVDSAHLGPDSSLPDLNSHLASLDADLTATAAENTSMGDLRGSSRAKAELATQRSNAQNVFAAKADAAPPANATKRYLIIGGIGAVAMAGVGGYFYMQLQALSGSGNRLAVSPGTTQMARPIAAAPTLPTLPAKAPDATPAATAPVEAAQPPAAATAQTTAKTPASASRTAPIKPAVTAQANTQPASAKPLRLAAASASPKSRNASAMPPADATTAATEPLRVTAQTQDSPATRAHEALQAGQLDAARAGYQQALRVDRKNADALVGLGTVLQREGDSEGAERHFQQAIEIDPRHAAAHAGLVAIRGAGDPAGAESRLKTLINLQNSDPAAAGMLSFTLGNVYAGQRRWSDAQQAYFKAFTSDAEHPDYLYNLAVSLDHLGQPGVARQYYDQALAAAKKRPAAFDKAQGERRLAELSR